MIHKVIYLDDRLNSEEKPIQFTHFLIGEKWREASDKPEVYHRVIYAGKNNSNGDIFICIPEEGDEDIMIFKGHLNSGKY